jgi:DNA-binding CsgD family transcriptional regulator
MVASATALERSFSEVKRICYAGLDAPTLLRTVAARMRRVAPFEAYCAQTNDPVSGLLTQVLTTEALGDKEHRQYVEQIYFQADRDEQRRMVWNHISVIRLSDMTDGKLERAPRYRKITRPLGLHYEVLALCAVGRQQWGGINLIRERGRVDFDAREVALLRRLAPHIGAGLQTAALRALATAKPEAESVPGVLVLDARGRVAQYTEAAEHYLRELDDLGPDWRDGCTLPAPVWVVVGALKRALAPETERDLQSSPRLCVQTRAGHWLTLHGTRTLSDGGRQDETVVIIEPSRLRELAWLRASAYGLSERERAVVDRVAQGASTKEIARALYISEYTVQEHLSHSFDKVGVRGRQALVQRLFFDHLAPGMLTASSKSECGTLN